MSMGFAKRIILLSILVMLMAGFWYVLTPRQIKLSELNLKHCWSKDPCKNSNENNTAINEFHLRFAPDVVDDLKMRLSRTRFFGSLEDVEWEFGVHTKYVKNLIDYWLQSFSWQNQLDELNKYKHFRTNIDGIQIHFVHVKVKHTDVIRKSLLPRPLILIHGWPGSFYNFYKVIPLLIKGELNFEIVIPSLPGYGFSEPAKQKGLDEIHMAVILDKLMKRLGYDEYYTQGGDWGGIISKSMAMYFPSRVKGVHLNLYPCSTPYQFLTYLVGSIAPSLLIPDARQRSKAFPLKKRFRMMFEETGYLHIQATKPDTVGFALNDSPAGLAAYIIEKFAGWSGCQPNASSLCIENHFTKDDLLTNIMIYWISGSMPSSMRLYRETFSKNTLNLGLMNGQVDVPTALADFPDEPFNLPKPWVEHCYKNIVSFTEMPRGGHFAASQEPELLAEDLIKFIKKVEGL